MTRPPLAELWPPVACRPEPARSSLRRPTVTFLAAALSVAVFALTLVASPAGAVGREAAPPPVPLPPPRAAIVVDAGSGAILVANNDRAPVPVASAFKIFTALAVHRRVKPTDLVPISPRAESMPARKINVKAGQRWTADGLLHAMLLASANDAAVAMAERAGGGTTAGYERLFRSEARALHLQDHPVLQDPAGLDDEFSVNGGNLISARDMAIVTQAFLAQPDLAEIVTLPEYSFAGGDGVQHRVVNHNRFLRGYVGAIGVKTGYTKRSGYTLIAAARRNGHTLIAIAVASPNTIQQASSMLDVGFEALRAHNRVLGYLPGSRHAPHQSPARHRSAPSTRGPLSIRGREAVPLRASSGTPGSTSGSSNGILATCAVLFVGLSTAIVLRRRHVVRRRRVRARARARAQAGAQGAVRPTPPRAAARVPDRAAARSGGGPRSPVGAASPTRTSRSARSR